METSLYKSLRKVPLDKIYSLNSQSTPIVKMAEFADTTPKELLSVFPLWVKVAHASETEEDYEAFIASGEIPPIKLTASEMELIKGGVAWSKIKSIGKSILQNPIFKKTCMVLDVALGVTEFVQGMKSELEK